MSQDIILQAGNMGRDVPQAFSDPPKLLTGNDLYLHAFYDLDSERGTGMGIGRIPWSSTEHYADVYGFDYEQRLMLRYCIKAMDGAYMKHVTSKQEKGGK